MIVTIRYFTEIIQSNHSAQTDSIWSKASWLLESLTLQCWLLNEHVQCMCTLHCVADFAAVPYTKFPPRLPHLLKTN